MDVNITMQEAAIIIGLILVLGVAVAARRKLTDMRGRGKVSRYDFEINGPPEEFKDRLVKFADVAVAMQPEIVEANVEVALIGHKHPEAPRERR